MSRSEDRSPRWTIALPIIVLGAYLVALMIRFAYKGDLYLSFFVDDFFFYLVVAKNLAFHGASTFNGLQTTNGYHPLWLLTITLLYRILGTGLPFFVALVTLIWLLVCGSYLAMRRAQMSLDIGGNLGLALALLSITFMAVLARSGMEVGLALFFLSLLWWRLAAQPLERQTPAGAFVSGVIASAVVLSRLDTCLIVAVYGALTLYRPSGNRRTALKQILWFSAALLPVAVYFLVNQIEFGTFLPVSGVVKNLKSTWWPSSSAVSILALPRLVNIFFTWPSLALCLLFLLCALRDRRVGKNLIPADRRRVQLCVALHPFIFYGVLSFTSDWPMWWIWYLYPMVPVLALLGPALLTRWMTLRRPATLCLAAMTACVSLVTLLDRVGTNQSSVFALQRALSLRDFAASHPGRYGMGDASGMMAYLSPVPVLQLEGLTGDKAYVDRIRRQEPLLQALKELGVDYYVTVHPGPDGACHDVREPAQAGPNSPAMRAHLCAQPVADIRPAGDPHHALVFDMHTLPAVSAAQSN